MSAEKKEADALVELGVEALCDELEIDSDLLPPGAKAVILRLCEAVFEKGRDAGKREAHTASTIPPRAPRTKTDTRFPAQTQFTEEPPTKKLPKGVLEQARHMKKRR